VGLRSEIESVKMDFDSVFPSNHLLPVLFLSEYLIPLLTLISTRKAATAPGWASFKGLVKGLNPTRLTELPRRPLRKHKFGLPSLFVDHFSSLFLV